MDCFRVIQFKNHVIEDQALRITDRVVADNPLLCCHLDQVNILDMFPHIRDALKGARPLLVWKPLVFDANSTLGLLTDHGKFINRLGGLRSGRFPLTRLVEAGTTATSERRS
jgi:hypothetical protein